MPAGIDQCQGAGCRQAIGEEVIDGVVLGHGSVRPCCGERRPRSYRCDATATGRCQRSERGISVARGSCGEALWPVGNPPSLNPRVAEPVHARPATRTERGPPGGRTVADIAWPDRHRRELDFAAVGVNQDPVAPCEGAAIRNAEHHHCACWHRGGYRLRL